MRRTRRLLQLVAAILIALGVIASASGCDASAVQRWRTERGLARLSDADATRLAAGLTAIEAELDRRRAFSAVVTTPAVADLGESWRPGCPVGPADLRSVSVSYWGFDNAGHTGVVVVHRSNTSSLVAALRELWNQRFPIEAMVPISSYGGDDRASMLANNTSGFNCRTVAGTSKLSEHAYGRAIDINPFRNPWVSRSKIDPPEAAAYADRSRRDPGIFHDGDDSVAALEGAGWKWGGHWATSKDYQHFSVSGR